MRQVAFRIGDDIPMVNVSVIVPVYNHEEYIEDCVESILPQTYRNFEVIVVDDGSTDNTAEKLLKYRDKINYLYKENGGGASALNVGIKASKGNYIAWLSSDDMFLPEKLELQIKRFEEDPELGLVHSDWYTIDKKGKITGHEKASNYGKDKVILELLKHNFINGSTTMIRRECFLKVGLFDENMRYSADGDLWSRLIRYYEFGHIPLPLIKYRWHDKNLSYHSEMMQRSREIYISRILERYSIEEIFPDIVKLKGEDRSFTEIYAHTYLGNILFKKKMFDLAFQECKKAIEVNPSDVPEETRILLRVIKDAYKDSTSKNLLLSERLD